MTLVTLESYLLVGAALFVLGMVGFLTRRNMNDRESNRFENAGDPTHQVEN